MKKLFLASLLFFLTQHIYSQPSVTRDFKIMGYTTDSRNNPIPYANIAVCNSADSALIKGVTSDEKGKFTVTLAAGDYYFRISFITFDTKIISPVKVRDKDLDLGKIILEERTEMINEVVITGEKSQLQLNLDKKIFNVGSDITSLGGNAADVLNKVPSVAVEMDGTVTLRGSQNVRILVDGKPSGLVGLKSTDALRQLQGDIIEKVEVITNPSAKFDAAGEVGIINLVLKKNKNKGLNGTFTANAGYPLLLGGSYSINYRKDKINFFSTYGVTDHTENGRGSTYQSYNGTDTSFLFTEAAKNTRHSFSHNFTFGMDYFFNEKSMLTASFIYEKSKERTNTDILYKDFSIDNTFLQSSKRAEIETANEDNIEAALNFRRKFDRKDQEFTVDLKWMQTTEPEYADIKQFDAAGNNVLNDKGGTGENEYNYLLQADYVQPYLEKGKIETGIKSNIRLVNSEYFLERQENGGDWVALPQFTNNLNYNEKILAYYLMTSYEARSFALQFGLRTEYSDITTLLTKTDEKNHRSYLDFFPSGNISYKMNGKNTFQLSYSRRLNRPGFRDLMPYNGFGDSRILFQGNPDLNPEYTNSYETGYLYDNENFNFMSTVYYRHRTGVIQRFATVDQNGITHVIPINISVQNAYGLEGNIDLEISKAIRMNSNFNFYEAVSTGQYQGEDFSSETFSWTNRSSLSVKFLKYDCQSTLNYRAPRNTPQGKDLASWYVDLGLRRDLFKGKGTIAFNVRDLFNSRKRISVIDSDGLYSRNENQFRMRQFMLTFTYRLNRDNNKEERDNETGGPGEGEVY
jgi:outer membrane receptor protein involved in Fe transport